MLELEYRKGRWPGAGGVWFSYFEGIFFIPYAFVWINENSVGVRAPALRGSGGDSEIYAEVLADGLNRCRLEPNV